MALATYTKLRSGQWGVRVQGEVKPGDQLIVGTRSMKAHSEKVDKIIWRGDGVVLCSLVPRERGKRKRPRKSKQPALAKH